MLCPQPKQLHLCLPNKQNFALCTFCRQLYLWTAAPKLARRIAAVNFIHVECSYYIVVFRHFCHKKSSIDSTNWLTWCRDTVKPAGRPKGNQHLWDTEAS